jgi:chromosomal replication initiation ATPase DnaA
MTTLEMRVEGLAARVRHLEELLLGEVNKIGCRTGATDAAMMESVCVVVGVELADVRSTTKAPHLVAKRRAVVNLLRQRLGWTWARIARATGKQERTVRRLLGKTSQ